MKAILALEDGTVYTGTVIGHRGRASGEVVFNTSMTGYQEILTDPSYRGQVIVMTYPLIGNYGVNDEDPESLRPQARGFVMRECCRFPSNWRAQAGLDQYLKEHRVVGIEGIDTRSLTRKLRQHGTMKGTVACDMSEKDAVLMAIQEPSISDQDLVSEVTTGSVVFSGDGGPLIVVVDLGAKRSILRSLVARRARVAVVPAGSTAQEILELRPDGVLVTNGPGDPEAAPHAIRAVSALVGKVPIFGICLGHQILGLALGGKTYKLKYGHRGANHPVKDLESGRVYVTSQNHGFAVDEGSLDQTEVRVSHVNLNDGTVEGLRHARLPVFSVQYHPEASPGPQESAYLFDRFLEAVAGGG